MFECHMNIPNEANWSERSLDQMCSVLSRGTAPVYVEHSDVMAIGQRCVSKSGFDADKARPHSPHAMCNVLIPETNDVLLNSTGTGTVGRSCVFSHPGAFIVDGHVTVMRSKAGEFKGEWLDAVLRTWWGQNHLERFCFSGSTNQVELSRSQLAATYLPVPTFPEQEQIAKILDTLDITIRQTEAIIAKLQQVKQGLLHDLLTRGINANSELRPPVEVAPHLYKESPLGWIPKEWEVKPIYNYGEVVTGSTPPSYDPLAWGEQTPFVTPVDVIDDVIISAERYVSKRGQRYVRLLPPNSILVVCIGSTIGKVGITGVESCTNQQINAVIPRENIEPDFLYRAIHKHIHQLRAMAGLQAVPIVNKSSFSEMLVPMPEADEQTEIAKRLFSASQRLVDESLILEKLNKQKSGLMDDLLTGRIRVTPLLTEGSTTP